MEWNGNFSSLWNMEDAFMEWKILRMEWKTVFVTSTPILYYIRKRLGEWNIRGTFFSSRMEQAL